MKVLIVNKFLYPNGGSETYIFKLGEQLESMGHEVQYFGMEHPDRCVGNAADSYTSNMDFHSEGIKGKLSKIAYPFKIIYSAESRRKIRAALEEMKPDVVHLNNINFQLTPSIILEIKRWNKDCRIVSTIHDPQWVCPNHMLINGKTHKGCKDCLNGSYMSCIKSKCVHGSTLKSVLGAMEAVFYKNIHVYRNVDAILCPSHFMEETMKHNPDIADRTIMLRNFIAISEPTELRQDRYVLYFGRYSEEKGIHTLVKASRLCPDIPFIFAGNGPFEQEVNDTENIKNVGFTTGTELANLIANAQMTLIASECYENCPFTVMESQMLHTPVIGADIGGIPELIGEGVNGDLFESGNPEDLADKIRALWEDRERLERYTEATKAIHYDSLEQYAKKVEAIYEGTYTS